MSQLSSSISSMSLFLVTGLLEAFRSYFRISGSLESLHKVWCRFDERTLFVLGFWLRSASEGEVTAHKLIYKIFMI